jgi:hypothetical protein
VLHVLSPTRVSERLGEAPVWLQRGWTHTEEELLQSQGQASAAFSFLDALLLPAHIGVGDEPFRMGANNHDGSHSGVGLGACYECRKARRR